jgi:hypothetical protein
MKEFAMSRSRGHAGHHAEVGTRRWIKRHPLVFGGAVLGFTAIAGSAYAYWTTTGSGTATGTTAASLATLTTTDNSTITAMAPGSAIQNVNFTINNSAATPQYVTTVLLAFDHANYISAAGAGTDTTLLNHPAGGSAPGCIAASFALTQPEAGVDVAPAGLAFTQLTAKKGGRIAMNDLVTNQDDCKDTTITLSFTLS